MGTLILALCLGLCTPAQEASQSAVSMPEYQTDQIIWWNYYGEWAPAPSDADSTPQTAKSKSNAKGKSSI